MSGISANGHQCLFVNFRHLDGKLVSNSVDDSQLNKLLQSMNNSVQANNHQIDCEFQKGGRHEKLNPKKSPDFYSAFSTQKPGNSESGEKNEKAPNSDELSARKIKVLIAEDDEVSSQLLAIMIKEISSEIIRTRTGKETVEQCKSHKDIDLILMDIKMPELDGLETTKKIREFNKNVYIIAQTARALEGDREEALFSGCNDYITKPIDRITLLDKIKKSYSF